MIRERIEEAVREALLRQGYEGQSSWTIERPRDMAHGDYSTNAALVGKVDPQELGSKLRSLLSSTEVEKVEVAGKFINFYLSPKELRSALVPKEEQASQHNAGKTILIEYTSPNLFKPLHIGNLVGNILGEANARLLERSGAAVKRINYPSDIGLTVAKGVWGLRTLGLDPSDIAQLGQAYVAGNAAYEDGSAKGEIESINKALYENTDPKLSTLRARGIDTSRKHLDDLCARLGTTFDREFFESRSGPVGTALVRENMGTVFEDSDGAVVYRGEQDGLHTRVFLNSQGLPTYEAKDLGLLKFKLDAYPDFAVTITDTGPEQQEYFKVLYAAAKKVLPQLQGKELRHTIHGYLKLTTGKMSSRLGNVITGESLIAELMEESRAKMQDRDIQNKEKIAEQVAVGAIKYAVLKQGSGKDIIFDADKSLSLEGDSGPYLQYAHVRAVSLLKKLHEAGIEPGASDAPQTVGTLERVLVHYSDAVSRAAKELEPHYLATFLTELAAAFNSWYAGERVIGGEHPHYGALLTAAVERTLREGLETLGIPVPEEM